MNEKQKELSEEDEATRKALNLRIKVTPWLEFDTKIITACNTVSYFEPPRYGRVLPQVLRGFAIKDLGFRISQAASHRQLHEKIEMHIRRLLLSSESACSAVGGLTRKRLHSLADYCARLTVLALPNWAIQLTRNRLAFWHELR